jgi:uncharacterized membrane protein YhaH (DUF805 family)
MDQQQSQQFANMAAGFIGVAIIFGLLFYALFIWMYWRALSKAGMAGALSLLVLIPAIGPIIPLAILAFGEWKVVPVQTAAPYYPPIYPPPPPPQSFQPPPTQL